MVLCAVEVLSAFFKFIEFNKRGELFETLSRKPPSEKVCQACLPKEKVKCPKQASGEEHDFTRRIQR